MCLETCLDVLSSLTSMITHLLSKSSTIIIMSKQKNASFMPPRSSSLATSPAWLELKGKSLQWPQLIPLLTSLRNSLRNWTSAERRRSPKHAFTTAVFLKHPDASKPFQVEVDASEMRPQVNAYTTLHSPHNMGTHLPQHWAPWETPTHCSVKSIGSWTCSTICAIFKVTCFLPADKLLPLPLLSCPWSHLFIGFSTDLNSHRHTFILIIADKFSKSIKLIPLPELRTSFQTTEILFHKIFLTLQNTQAHRQQLWPTIHVLHLFKFHGETRGLCESYHWLSSTSQQDYQ